MILPYKQVILENGLLVIYEEEVACDDAPLQVVTIRDTCYLLVGTAHLILLSVGVFECIEMTRKIFLAKSEQSSVSVAVQGHTVIDDVAMGKLIAYLEIGLEHWRESQIVRAVFRRRRPY